MNKALTNSFCPVNKQAWRLWLKENHLTEDAVWLIIYKKDSASPNLSWSEAVDEALCFGWIDSTKKSIDSEKYMQYFSKRKPTSTWSKINKEKVAELMEQGLMAPAGLASIKIAKQNGPWDMLNDIDSMLIPADLDMAFHEHEGAKAFFLSMSNALQKGMLFWIKQAKRTETRARRIAEIADNARLKKLPKQFR